MLKVLDYQKYMLRAFVTFLGFFFEVLHHVHKDMLCLAIKVLSLKRVFLLRGRSSPGQHLFTLKVTVELDNIILFILKGKHINYITAYYMYL